MAEVRNVLLIAADQWRGDYLSLLGHRAVRTPHLDRLAADGVCFLNHYAQSAPCGPARTSLLTGLYAMNHRSIKNGTPLDARHTNIALEARRGGYEPMLFGYTDTSLDPRGRDPADPATRRYQGVLPGFSVGVEFVDNNPRPWLIELARKGYSLPANPAAVYIPPAVLEGGRQQHLPAPYRAEDSDTALIADRLLDYLERQRGEPWFAHAVFLRPHPPFYAPEPYHSQYDPASMELPQRAAEPALEAAQHPFLRWWLAEQSRPGYLGGHPVALQNVDERTIRELRASYCALISEVDAQLGRIIEWLRSSGEYDRTLIVFTCDHGEMLGDHWLWNKGGYFDASYHIPLIIREPRRQSARGRRVEAFTESVDLMPTILEWLDLDVPAACDGVPLLPWLNGETPPRWRDSVHWEYDFRDPLTQRPEQALGLTSDQCTLNVLRGERYKYVHFSALPPLLFDLAEDPGERYDRASDPAYRDALLASAQQLLSRRMIHTDRTLSNTLLTRRGVVTHRGPRY